MICANELKSAIKTNLCLHNNQAFHFGWDAGQTISFLTENYAYLYESILLLVIRSCVFFSWSFLVNQRRYSRKQNEIREEKKNRNRYDVAHSYVHFCSLFISSFIYISHFVEIVYWDDFFFLSFCLTTFFGLRNYNTSVDIFQCRQFNREKKKKCTNCWFFVAFFLLNFQP